MPYLIKGVPLYLKKKEVNAAIFLNKCSLVYFICIMVNAKKSVLLITVNINDSLI